MATPELLDLAAKLRADLLKRDALAMNRLASAYAQIHRRALADLDNLVNAILAKGGDPTKGQVQRMAQYKSLIDDIEKEVGQFGQFLKTEVRMEAEQLISMASRDAKMLIARAYGDNAQITAMIKMLNPAFIETLLGFLEPTGKLWTYWDSNGAKAAADVARVIMESIGLGRGPLSWAGELTKAMGSSLTSGMRTARTIQLYTYREATRANYAANQDIVPGWQWYAELKTACPSCIAQHGKVFPNTQTLNDHWCGRCAAIPMTILDRPGDIESGEDWFKKQPEGTQRKILGPGKYDAWKAGKFEFGRIAQETDDKVWGKMWTETPLKELVPDAE